MILLGDNDRFSRERDIVERGAGTVRDIKIRSQFKIKNKVRKAASEKGNLSIQVSSQEPNPSDYPRWYRKTTILSANSSLKNTFSVLFTE